MGKYIEGKSIPTTQTTDLCDDDMTRRRILSFKHGSLAQKRLPC